MSERDDISAYSQEAPLLSLLHEALQSNATTLNGTMRGEAYVSMITEELSPDSALYDLEPTEQERVLGAVARAAYTLNKRQDAQSPFWENDARVQLVDEAARESLKFKAAGWTARMAVSLALAQPYDKMVALRDEFLREHGEILTVGRIVKFMDGNRPNPREPLELVVAAFKHTRQNERVLHCSDTDLFESLSMKALRQGNLTITPKKAALPELPLGDPTAGMEHIYATALPGRGNTLRKAGNASLVSYLQATVEAARQTSPQLQRLRAEEFGDFLQLVGWYADSSSYEAVNDSSYVRELAEKYAQDVVALEVLGMNRGDALRNATYHGATYYENVVTRASSYGMPKDNFVPVFVKRHPIDCLEKLEELRPLYDKLCQDLPDLQPGNRLLMAVRGLNHDIAQQVTNFQEALKEATVMFGGKVSAKVIQTICAIAPNNYMERLVSYEASHPGRSAEDSAE